MYDHFNMNCSKLYMIYYAFVHYIYMYSIIYKNASMTTLTLKVIIALIKLFIYPST